ncbi:protein ovarian tumor locus-like [Culex pipiens pallens]|uniref:protein ovarian tumor locus-like n=1 Tax=Culex pipiens pallens TaxID=42434 RepID=UPI001954E833|nr:protein ovarian tumor locus-like [Culex pipiens pallens]
MDCKSNGIATRKEEVVQENRPFASGSRQAPDPYDQFLEREGYYRKHVARDGTCLFRSFSEQVFDVQLYHGKVRKDCIRWMRINSDEYKKRMTGDFDDYLTEMSKSRTYGSFVELHALAHAYRRNVLLFEPYNLGSWFVNEEAYQETVMVFFSPDKHFDSIFPTSFIQQAAYCQALVYEILYVEVFKLPDVMYSVERMLHDPDGQALSAGKAWDKTDHTLVDRVVSPEGRQFVFDIADNTECVLDNYLLCHFHNKDNFDTIVDTYRNKRSENDLKETHNVKTNGTKGSLTRDLINPMLCDKKISCVRQLLKEGITPFPYKVAKALDPNIYRNIEFDSWSDVRRELKYRNWYFDQNCLQVGAKCLVRLTDSDECIRYGYIQEMRPDRGPCTVYVEDFAECRTVPYDRLQPLPLDQTRSFAIPYKFRRSTAVQHLKITCHNHSRKKMLKAMDAGACNVKSPDNEMYQFYTPYYDSFKPYCYTFKNFTSMNHFQPGNMEMMVMPFTTGGLGGKSKLNQGKGEPGDGNDRSAGNNDHQTDVETTYSSSGVYDMSASSSMSYNQPYCYTYAEPFPYDPTAPSAYCALPYSAQQFAFAPHGTFPGSFYGAPYPMTTPIGDIGNRTGGDEIPNFQAVASAAPNGSDLPLHDLVTLRYFYNLGVEYFRNNQFRLEPPAVVPPTRNTADVSSAMDDGNEIRDLANEFKHGMNFSAPNASDAQNKQRGSYKTDIHQSTKRKYGTKTPKKLTPNRNRVATPDASGPAVASVPCLDVGQSAPADHLATDVSQATYNNNPTYPYAHVPVMPPVRVPYYAVDSSHYMIPPYGHSFMAPSDVMLIHENAQPPALNPLEAQYPPMVFASPPVGTGFAIMGYPQPPTHLSLFANGNNHADNDCSDAAQ